MALSHIPHIAVVNTHLVAVKDGVRYPGPIEM